MNTVNNKIITTTPVASQVKVQAPKPEVQETAIATADTLETGPGRAVERGTIVAAVSQVAIKGAPKVAAEVVKDAVKGAPKVAAEVVKGAVKGAGATASWGAGLAGFLAATKAAIKANFLVAGAVSVVSNTADALQGKINLQQWAGLTAADTVAYGCVGIAATGAAAAAVTAFPAAVGMFGVLGPIGIALGPIGIAVGVGIGLSMLWSKSREKIRNALR